MRALLLLCLIAPVAACSSEPGFDARYNEQADQIEATASNIQQELDNQFNAAHAGERIGEEAADSGSGTAP